MKLCGCLGASPEPATGVVLFAHGSGRNRRSRRSHCIAAELYRAGLGTLLLDLLTAEEELNRANVFDTELLARRLAAASLWLDRRPDAAGPTPDSASSKHLIFSYLR